MKGMGNTMRDDLTRKYPYLRAWNVINTPGEERLQAIAKRADEENAPFDLIYRDLYGRWQTVRDLDHYGLQYEVVHWAITEGKPYVQQKDRPNERDQIREKLAKISHEIKDLAETANPHLLNQVLTPPLAADLMQCSISIDRQLEPFLAEKEQAAT